ncbi:MAG TPA: 30S ribosomal protein S16 [Candidatus Woesebacteria bacterium]|nr:30S ribosomal protein S16 [Candidatus Woesebacteria bacterium]
MAVTLRLMRFGKKKTPFYRIVALDKRQKRDGAYLDKVGVYHPLDTEKNIRINKTRYEYWTSKGAQISEGFARLLKNKKDIVFE